MALVMEKYCIEVRLDDPRAVEVKRLPFIKTGSPKLSAATKKAAFPGEPVVMASCEPLQNVLNTSVQRFGKDPHAWLPTGADKVLVVEGPTERLITTTSILSGMELSMFLHNALYDPRLPVREDHPELSYNSELTAITTNEAWQEVLRNLPMSSSKRRQQTLAFLMAKMSSGSPELMEEGCHGLWELSINKAHHADVPQGCMELLVGLLGSGELKVAIAAAAALWGLVTTAGSRLKLLQAGFVSSVLDTLSKSLEAGSSGEPPEQEPPPSHQAATSAAEEGAAGGASAVAAVPEDVAVSSSDPPADGVSDVGGTGAQTRSGTEAGKGPWTETGQGVGTGEGVGPGAGTGADSYRSKEPPELQPAPTASSAAPPVPSPAPPQLGLRPQQLTLQRLLLGALATAAVDRRCRLPLLQLEPGLDTLLACVERRGAAGEGGTKAAPAAARGSGGGRPAGTRGGMAAGGGGLSRNVSQLKASAAASSRSGRRPGSLAGPPSRSGSIGSRSGSARSCRVSRTGSGPLADRRVSAAKVLTSLLQRDGEARLSLIATGSLQRVQDLLQPKGPGKSLIQFCMTLIMAAIVRDEAAMRLIKERGEAARMFHVSLELLVGAMRRLDAELDARHGTKQQGRGQPGGMLKLQSVSRLRPSSLPGSGGATNPDSNTSNNTGSSSNTSNNGGAAGAGAGVGAGGDGDPVANEDEEDEPYDLDLGVRLAEAAAMAAQGSMRACCELIKETAAAAVAAGGEASGPSHPSLSREPVRGAAAAAPPSAPRIPFSERDVMDLASIAVGCWSAGRDRGVPLGEICRCVMLALAELASGPETAGLMLPPPPPPSLLLASTASTLSVAAAAASVTGPPVMGTPGRQSHAVRAKEAMDLRRPVRENNDLYFSAVDLA